VEWASSPFLKSLLTLLQDVSYNPLLKAMSERLLGRGKVKMQVIGALMRKLVHLAFGILKSQKHEDPNYAIATP
jgi:hypothetical protein